MNTDLPLVGELRIDSGSGWQVMNNQPVVIHKAATDTAFGDTTCNAIATR